MPSKYFWLKRTDDSANNADVEHKICVDLVPSPCPRIDVSEKIDGKEYRIAPESSGTACGHYKQEITKYKEEWPDKTITVFVDYIKFAPGINRISLYVSETNKENKYQESMYNVENGHPLEIDNNCCHTCQSVEKTFFIVLF